MNNSLFRMFAVIVCITTFCCAVAGQTKDSVYSSRTEVMGSVRSPYISVQQMLKGVAPGLYVQENNGEPGTMQSMLLRGLAIPVFSNQDVSGNQPVVYVNGIPLLDDNSFSYGIKSNSINPVGNATNPLAGLDLNNIISIKVIKDPAELAKLGPMAANGAVWITTKDGWSGGYHVSLGAWMSYVAPPTDIKMTNGATEIAFRKQFYDTYGLNVNSYLPAYLAHNKDPYFFEKPDWADEYYQYAPQYNIHASIGGGDQKSNYLFAVGTSNNAGVVSGVGFNKYNISFGINLKPVTGLTIGTLINAIRMERDRNTNIRDRYAEIEYMPELITPISPTKVGYAAFLAASDLTKDNNVSNRIFGQMVLDYKNKGFYANAGLRLDWNNNTRQAFFPSTLMESVSYVSDYWGYNRRMNASGNVGYDFQLGTHLLNVELGGSYQQDFHHYNYTRAFDGSDDRKPTTSSGNFAYLYRYVDELDYRLLSEYASLGYSFKDYLNVNAIFRYDGTSNVQNNHHWLFSPAFSAKWNLKNAMLSDVTWLSDLSLRGSWARVGKLYETDRFMSGPYYSSENINWKGQALMASYSGYATITRPYSSGWSDYGFSWPVSDKWELSATASFLKNRLNTTVTYYNNTDKNMSVAVPVAQELGYQYQYLSGMKVNNRGVEVELFTDIFSNPEGFSWNASLNMAMNWNKLKSLPNGMQSVVIGDRKLEVGHSIDEFWLYKNKGIYANDSEVPTKNGKTLSYLGSVPFQAGDPRWEDVNGDNVIDEDDKVLTGHSTPPLTGGFSSSFRWKQFDLGFQLFFALGHDAVNYRSSQRYDFTTLDKGNTLASVKEIFFWQNTNDKNGFSIYNPLSEVHPYQANQDIFLEKLSYLKLRSVTLGYTVPIKVKSHSALTTLKSLYIYLSGNNLLTVSGFSGDDPELIDFDGYYRGYGQPIPRSVTIGVKLNF